MVFQGCIEKDHHHYGDLTIFQIKVVSGAVCNSGLCVELGTSCQFKVSLINLQDYKW